MEAIRDLFFFGPVEASGDALRVEARLNAEHPVFEGHFPGQPVLPGVCQVALIKQLIRGHLASPCPQLAVREVKFLRAIRPTEQPVLNVQIQLRGEDLQATVSVGGGLATRLKARIQA